MIAMSQIFMVWWRVEDGTVVAPILLTPETLVLFLLALLCRPIIMILHSLSLHSKASYVRLQQPLSLYLRSCGFALSCSSSRIWLLWEMLSNLPLIFSPTGQCAPRRVLQKGGFRRV